MNPEEKGIAAFHILILSRAMPHNLTNNGRKINVWRTNKFSKELHTAVSVVFSVPSSVQSKMVKNCSDL